MKAPEQVLPSIQERIGEFGEGATLGQGVEIIGDASCIKVGAGVSIGDGARLVCAPGGSITLGAGTVIQPRAYLDTGKDGHIKLGERNSVNPYCVIYGHGGLTTGAFVRIAAHTVIIPANHIYDDSTLPIARERYRST